jgi:gamma-glutamyl hercynylcysteine S-oxide synthase
MQALTPSPLPLNARALSGPPLAAALCESRTRTWALVQDLTPAQWLPAKQRGVNPLAWELAHIAWFAEFWILRGPHHRSADGLAQAAQPPRFAGPDAVLDSAQLAHAQRWTQDLPTRAKLVPMLQGQLDACIAAIPTTDLGVVSDDALYFHRLALFHEDMHAEAFCWLRAALGYSAPTGVYMPTLPTLSAGAPQALALPSGDFRMGSSSTDGAFSFDNECPAQWVSVQGFEIDSAPVSAGEFARFVDAGGYNTAQFWPGHAGTWRAQSTCAHPQRWQRDSHGAWQVRWFDQWLALDPQAPVMHVNAFEAQAYCLWAGRRLPTAREWEYAAQQAPAFHWGHSVWEWTADAFAPYPGFAPGPYLEYSQPWFGTHRELRGGAFATHARMHHPCYRNFFELHRTDVFAGFRTATL